MRRIGMLACGLALAACNQTTGSGSQPEAEMPPADYRQIAIAGVKDVFFDPYSIRDAEIAPPFRAMGPSLNSDGLTTPWIICMRANGKNRMGAYTGRRITALAVSGGKVVNSWGEHQQALLVCGNAAFEPFPEIEEGYRPPTAPARGQRRPS